MRVLLDTHALLWATVSPAFLSTKAASVIADPKYEILVSAASAWEIATKFRLGRLEKAGPLEENFIKYMQNAGYTLLVITVEDGLRAGRLLGEHKDPFDRMIAAQALREDIPIISTDNTLDCFGVRRIW